MIPWPEIEARLSELKPVTGGYSLARRGLLELEGRKAFIKMGQDDNTKKWAQKEVAVYRFLEGQAYPYAPKLLAVSEDETGFAIQVLIAEDGWDWSANWSVARLEATLAALDALAEIQPNSGYDYLFRVNGFSSQDNGWAALEQSTELRDSLKTKLDGCVQGDLAFDRLGEFARRVANFEMKPDKLVHLDVRHDNCAWSAKLGQVRLVDWDWARLGDRRIELAALLSHAQQGDIDVTAVCSDRLDSDALLWLAGFWLKSAATPIWPGGPETLRDAQAKSGITALQLAQRLSAPGPS